MKNAQPRKITVLADGGRCALLVAITVACNSPGAPNNGSGGSGAADASFAGERSGGSSLETGGGTGSLGTAVGAGSATTSSGDATASDGAIGGGGAASSGGRRGTGGTTGRGGATGIGGSDVGASATPQIPTTPLPTLESESFALTSVITDVADDCAIYANPTAPELSVVVADNKDGVAGGVGVFDMQGKLLQFRQDGEIGNIDLRAGFPLGSQSIVLVGANNRSTNTLIFWQLDPATRQLSAPIGDATRTISPSYGFCLYHSVTSGKFYAFVTQETGKSTMEQYELGESNGNVTATKVRSFEVGSITEGCVADDELGSLYVAQEDVALWRYGAEPSSGSTRTQVAAVGDGHLVADLEGISLAKGPGRSGYIVLSIQSEDRFVRFDRETNAYIRGFTVGANGDIDTVTQTDGLDISTSNLGPGFTKGALVVHDGSNADGQTSNLKYIALE